MKMDRSRVIRLVLIGFLLFLMIYWFMFSGQTILLSARPIFIGLAIAYTLNIMITFFRNHDFLYNRKILKSERVHNILSVVLAVILLLACVSFIIGYIVPEMTSCVIPLLDRVPSGIRYVLKMPLVQSLLPDDTLKSLEAVDWTNWLNRIISLVNSKDLISSMTLTASSALNVISSILFGILFACYFLSGKQTARNASERMVRAFVPAERQEGIFFCGRLLNECFHNFIVCQALQALIIGISATVLMNIFGFPYASMVGTLNGFCALIPVIGGYIGAILGTLMILTDSPSSALFFLIFIVVLQNVIGTIIFPKLIGNSLGLPSVWTLAAVLIGSGLAGIVGILLGVPLTAFFYRLVKKHLETREAALAAASPAPPEAGPPDS